MPRSVKCDVILWTKKDHHHKRITRTYNHFTAHYSSGVPEHSISGKDKKRATQDVKSTKDEEESKRLSGRDSRSRKWLLRRSNQYIITYTLWLNLLIYVMNT